MGEKGETFSKNLNFKIFENKKIEREQEKYRERKVFSKTFPYFPLILSKICYSKL
jgi:hypothetical protein